MTGNQNIHAVIVFFSAVINVCLNAIMIPAWGINGAAVATCITTVVWNLWMSVIAHRRIGVVAFVLPGRIFVLCMVLTGCCYYLFNRLWGIYVGTVLFVLMYLVLAMWKGVRGYERGFVLEAARKIKR